MAGIVGLALSSCDKHDDDLGVMQRNEAPVIVPADGVAIQSLYVATGNEINLQDYVTSVYVPLMDIQISTKFSEEALVTGLVEISNTPDFTNVQTIELSSIAMDGPSPLADAVEGDSRYLMGFVKDNEWSDAFQSFYKLDPAPNVNYLRYRLWLTTGDEKMILYSQSGNEWWDAMEFMVTPINVDYDVAPSYTLFYTLGGQEYSQVMYHNDANHQYDDPIFNAMVEVPEDENEQPMHLEWWVAPTDNLDKTYGVAEDEPFAMSGSLGLMAGGDAMKGQINDAGSFKIEVNMLDLTYAVRIAPKSLYVVSTSYISFKQAAQLGTEDYINYSGMAGIESGWGLTGQEAYKPIFYSNDTKVAPNTVNGITTGSMLFDTTGAPLNSNSAIPLPGQRGLFYVTANLQTLTYTAYRCSTMGIVGEMTNWGNKNEETGETIQDIQLTIKRADPSYYMQLTGTFSVEAGQQWKIRANSDWDIVNFGSPGDGSYNTDGTPTDIAFKGENFIAPESGTFNITVNLRRTLENGVMTPYQMIVTKVEGE